MTAAVMLACGSVLAGPKKLIPADKGAFETRQYRNVFVEAGYSPEAVDAKVAEVFEEVFFGPDKVYFEAGMTWRISPTSRTMTCAQKACHTE